MPGLRIFRIFRVVRVVRIARRLGGPRVFGELRQQLSSGAVYLVIFVLFTVLEVVGLLELYFEEDAAGANIKTAGDALWWGYVTATTIGYVAGVVDRGSAASVVSVVAVVSPHNASISRKAQQRTPLPVETTPGDRSWGQVPGS